MSEATSDGRSMKGKRISSGRGVKTAGAMFAGLFVDGDCALSRGELEGE